MTILNTIITQISDIPDKHELSKFNKTNIFVKKINIWKKICKFANKSQLKNKQ